MTKSDKSLRKRLLNYMSNGLLVLIILVLIIPSWRSQFQTWFRQLTMSETHFSIASKTAIPADQKNWELFNMNGELINFAEFEGKPVVLNFWATWCVACRAEFPNLGGLRNNWDDEIVFASVTTESPEVVHNSGMDKDYDFLYCTQNYPPFFEISVFPTLVIIDKQMNMVYKLEGAYDINTEENIAFLNTLLKSN